MSEVLQDTLFDYKRAFPNFETELPFWIKAAVKICEDMLGEGVDNFLPEDIAKRIEERYPVKQPINEDNYRVLTEELAEVCAFYDGAHGYRGVFIPERLNYGGQNEYKYR